MTNLLNIKLRSAWGRIIASCVAVTLMLTISVRAEAASPEVVSVKLTQSKVVVEKGKERLRKSDQVKPGDTIEYHAVYTNNGNKPVTGLVATLPLPIGLEYIPKSAKPSTHSAQASAVDGQYATEPLMRPAPQGGQETAVPYSEYRSLRWNVGELGAGKSFEIRARARIVSNAVQSNVQAANDKSFAVSRSGGAQR